MIKSFRNFSNNYRLRALSCQFMLCWKSQHSFMAALKNILIFCICCSSVHVQLFATTWTAALQVSLSIANSWSLLKLMSTELVMLSNHFILCHALLLLPSIFPSIRVFSSESALCIRWPKFWSFSFSISPSNEYSGLIYFRIDWTGLISLLSRGLSRVFSSTTVQKYQFFSTQPSL